VLHLPRNLRVLDLRVNTCCTIYGPISMWSNVLALRSGAFRETCLMQYVRFGAAFCWHPLSGIGVVVPQASSSGERTRSAPHASCGRTPHSECSNVIRSLDFFFAFPRGSWEGSPLLRRQLQSPVILTLEHSERQYSLPREELERILKRGSKNVPRYPGTMMGEKHGP